MLTPLERVRVNVAIEEHAHTSRTVFHRNSVDEIVQDLRTQTSNTVLVSVAQYDPANTARMAAMVREFPRVPAYALLTEERRSNPQSVLSLGQVGVRTLIDARFPSGWQKLRALLLTEQSNDIQLTALATLNNDLKHVSHDCWRFFELLFTYYPYITSVRQLARQACVLPATLLSRFYRMKLPSPKRYIDVVRLIRAARLLENTGLSISAVARQLDYSSPQAFCRHTRAVLHISPLKFRQQYSGISMLQRFRSELIVPYLHTLRSFHPIIADPSWITPSPTKSVSPSSTQSQDIPPFQSHFDPPLPDLLTR